LRRFLGARQRCAACAARAGAHLRAQRAAREAQAAVCGEGGGGEALADCEGDIACSKQHEAGQEEAADARVAAAQAQRRRRAGAPRRAAHRRDGRPAGSREDERDESDATSHATSFLPVVTALPPRARSCARAGGLDAPWRRARRAWLPLRWRWRLAATRWLLRRSLLALPQRRRRRRRLTPTSRTRAAMRRALSSSPRRSSPPTCACAWRGGASARALRACVAFPRRRVCVCASHALSLGHPSAPRRSCRTVTRGRDHPGDICEAASLWCAACGAPPRAHKHACSCQLALANTQSFCYEKRRLPLHASPSSFRSAIALPKTDYPLFDALPARLPEEGLLSKLQLEGILYACAVRRFRRERSAACVP
jgi:hypothetical protein